MAHPFVKWVGGKRALMSELIAHLPPQFNSQTHCYYEPFLGGGALFFALQSGQWQDETKPLIKSLIRANLSDANLDLTTTYQVVKSQPNELIDKLKEHQVNHNLEYYYQIRHCHNLESSLEIAARFIYLNKTCYNGLYRVNSQGHFNVPIGKYKDTSAIVQAENILACSAALQGINLDHQGFDQIKPQSGDFVYFDPPYDPIDQGISAKSFTKYAKLDFTKKDQIALRDFAITLHENGVYVMISNSNTQFIRDLYQDKFFYINLVTAPRFINSKASQRGGVTEVLICNYS